MSKHVGEKFGKLTYGGPMVWRPRDHTIIRPVCRRAYEIDEVMTLELDLAFIKQSLIQKFSSKYQSMQKKNAQNCVFPIF